MPLLTRRTLLKSAAVAGLCSALPRIRAAQPANAAVLDYLARHARPDGGYAFADQQRSHLTPTYAVIGAYRLLGQTPPKRAALTEYVRTHHPRELKKLEQERRIFEFQQVQALVWLGDPPDTVRPPRLHGFPRATEVRPPSVVEVGPFAVGEIGRAHV